MARLESLRAIHLPKSAVIHSADFDIARFDAQGFIPGAFLIVSCQRWIWVCTPAELPARLQTPYGLEIHAGVDAYDFLLRIACGLESEIAGETDIFGQLKQAWSQNQERLSATLRGELAPWIQRLFEDTKEIRSQHLQDVGGGASYGTLVRKIIRDRRNSGPILVIGAGQIARSVAPYLKEHELWLWNRGKANLELLQKELGPQARTRIIPDEELENAWKLAVNAVVCVPADSAQESERAKLWCAGAPDRGSVIHLGGYSHQCSEWADVQGFFALDALFQLQKSRGDVRDLQVARARQACLERAKLRALGSSLNIPHGWEDLAAFA